MMLDTALGFGVTFQDLQERDGLVRLDQMFLQRLAEADAVLHLRLLTARAEPLPEKDESALIIDLGPHLDAFVAELFGIEAEIGAVLAETLALDPVHACKRLFVQRQAVRRYPDPSAFDGPALRQALEVRFGTALTEKVFAACVLAWEKASDTEALDDEKLSGLRLASTVESSHAAAAWAREM